MIFSLSQSKGINIPQEIKNKVECSKTNELLLIVPTNRKSRYLKKDIITASPGGTASGINIETLGTFAQKLISYTSISPGRILSEAASAVLLKQSFAACELRYFSNYRNDVPAGTLERIKNVLSEYKRHGITPSLILEESELLESTEKIKAADIASIFTAYNDLCSRLNVKEIGDIYDELNNITPVVFEGSFRKLYPKVDLIIIDGFDEFTSPEIELITSTANVKGLELFLKLDYYGLNENIFSHLDKCYSKLLAKKFLIIDDETEEDTNHFKRIIREKLFMTGRPVKGEFNINKIEALSREKEVEFIAKEVKQLILSGAAEPDKICVVFNLIKNYSPLIRDVFPVYGLPFNLTDRKSLSLSSPVITIINFLEILENDFYYKNIFRALSSGYIKLDDLNLSNLYTASVKLKIISGHTNWESTLKEGIAKEEKEKSGKRNLSQVYKKALADIKTIYGILAPFSRKMSVKEFHNLLKSTVFNLGIEAEILNNKSDNVEENIKGLTEFINTLEELFELLELKEGDKKFSLKYYLNNIRTAVSGTRFNIKEKPGYGVQVTNLNEIRGLQFDYLFIGGLADGDLPTRYQPEIFFSGSYSRNEKYHQTQERYRFYQSLCSWNRKLYLTYPRLSDKKELVKSNMLAEFENLFTCIVKDVKDYDSLVYSKEELLNLIGKGVDIPEYEGIEKIKTSIAINNNRLENPRGETEFTGSILNNLNTASKDALREYCEREFSVSQLEKYAGCPFQYFAERVLELSTIEEPAEEIEAKELGSLLHTILYRFYSEMKERGLKLKNADDECFKSAIALIFYIAEEEISAASFSPLSFYEKEKILGINGRKEQSILYRFLELERNADDGYSPAYFETTFGDLLPEQKDKGELLKNFRAGKVKVRGKIDRIDVDEKAGLYKIIDYKSGSSKPREKDIAEGLSLQLPLYMIAARELIKFRSGKDLQAGGGEIFTLKYSEKQMKRHTIIKEGSSIADECIRIIENYVDSIEKGQFKLTSLNDREDGVCRYCNYRTLCRIDALT